MLNAIEETIMVNQINDSAGLKTIEMDSRLKSKSREEKEQPIAENAVSSDSVNFSDASKQLEALKMSFKDIPDVDAIKISHFKAAIESGNYHINSDNIAKKMLNNWEIA